MSKMFTLNIQDLRQECNVYSLEVRWHSKIKDVKDLLHRTTGIPPSRQQLFQSNCSIPLSSSLTLHCLNIDRSGYTLRLSIIDSDSIGAAGFILNHAQETSLDQECSNILADIRNGLRRENMPIKTDVLDCTGGVYFMRALCGRKVAVFKPFDEEQGMPNNTKGYQGTGELGLRQFTKPGYGCVREVAAYIMDVNNFCRVPPTLLVHCEHPVLNYPEHGGCKGHPYPKLGSLQKFVHALDTFEDIGMTLLSDLEVQKVALLDLRLLNGDRNASNILAISKKSDGCSCKDPMDCTDRSSPVLADTDSSSDASSENDLYALVPIDHGYCLPSRLLINEVDWAWFYYPQVKHPVHEDVKKYLLDLDLDLLLKNMLAQVCLSEDSIFLTKISHKLIVDGIAAGLTLFDIANIVARVTEDTPSPLEKAIEEAEENAYRTIEMRVGATSRSPRSRAEKRYLAENDESNQQNKRASSVEGTRILHHLSPEMGSEFGSRDSAENVRDRETSGAVRRLSAPHLLTTSHGNGHIGNGLIGSGHLGNGNGHIDTGKGVRFRFHDHLTRIDESTGCTDSSGTNTPSLLGTSSTEHTEHPATIESCLLGINNLHIVHSSDDFDVPCASIALTAVPTTGELTSSQSPVIARAFPRIPFIDADEALESRIGSPVTVRKCTAYNSIPPSALETFNEDWEAATEFILPSQPNGRMKRVNTLNHVASPERIGVEHDSCDLKCKSAKEMREVGWMGEREMRGMGEMKGTGGMGDMREIRVEMGGMREVGGMSRSWGRMPPTLISQLHHSAPLSPVLLFDHPIAPPSVSASDFTDLGTKSSDTAGTDGYCNDEDDDFYPTDHDGSPPSAPQSPTSASPSFSFLRVTSFSAFSSAPIYDAEGAERRIGNLLRERRRQIALTSEFARTRLLFARNSVGALISKSMKVRSGSVGSVGSAKGL